MGCSSVVSYLVFSDSHIRVDVCIPVRGAYKNIRKRLKISQVSILAPCAGSVLKVTDCNLVEEGFNSRPPVRGAYSGTGKTRSIFDVSILAPCARSVIKSASVLSYHHPTIPSSH